MTPETIGFFLLGGVFVWAGANHCFNFNAVASSLAERQYPAPAFLLGAGSLLEIIAGVCVAAGVYRSEAAMALILFTIAASVLLLDYWRFEGAQREGLRSAFKINIALIGGLMLAATR